MNIHQVNVSYSAEQDRLLMRINSLSGEEFRAWLTRRMALQWLPHLEKTAQAQRKEQCPAPDPAAPLSRQKEQLVDSFAKEAAVYGGDFQTPFQNKPLALPLGEEPLLVTEMSLTALDGARWQLILFERLPGRQRDLQLVMDPALTHGLLQLLTQGLQSAGWLQGPTERALQGTDDTRVPVIVGPEAAEDEDEGRKPRYLN